VGAARGAGGAVGTWRGAGVGKEPGAGWEPARSRSASARDRKQRIRDAPRIAADAGGEAVRSTFIGGSRLSRETMHDMAERLSKPKRVNRPERRDEEDPRALPASAALVRVMRTYTADPLMSGDAAEVRTEVPRQVDVHHGLKELLDARELELLQRVVRGE